MEDIALSILSFEYPRLETNRASGQGNSITHTSGCLPLSSTNPGYYQRPNSLDSAQDFVRDVFMWNVNRRKEVPYSALFDTGSNQYNFMVRNDALELGYDIMSSSEEIRLKGPNNQETWINEYAIPHFNVPDGRTGLWIKKSRFYLVDELPGGVQILLGHKFIKEYKCVTWDGYWLVIHKDNPSKKLSPEEQIRYDAQKRDGKQHQERRQDLIKAQRDQPKREKSGTHKAKRDT
ncbi:MAG: hypothetical protein Q9187_004879 [Circinaria calcarea]